MFGALQTLLAEAAGRRRRFARHFQKLCDHRREKKQNKQHTVKETFPQQYGESGYRLEGFLLEELLQILVTEWGYGRALFCCL